jgi:hypothetical protein
MYIINRGKSAYPSQTIIKLTISPSSPNEKKKKKKKRERKAVYIPLKLSPNLQCLPNYQNIVNVPQ